MSNRGLIGAAATAVGLVGVFGILSYSLTTSESSSGLESGRSQVEGLTISSQTVNNSGVCDTDGVNATYKTAYRTTPTRQYAVTATVVNNIAWPSCNGATVSVQLTNSANRVIGSGSTAVAGTVANGNVNTVVPISPQPNAHDATSVTVTLSGGTTPIPPECSSMTFDSTQVGTTGPDNMTGTNGNDLIYSLSGVDSISGLSGNDCLKGGPNTGDNDTITDGNGNDVILAGNGNDSVQVGNGIDLIKLGNGKNSIQLGNNTDTVYVGTGQNTVTGGNVGYAIYTGGRTGTALAGSNAQTVTISAGSGNSTIYLGNGPATVNLGNGNNTVYLGSTTAGSGTITLGKGSNTCHAPTLHPNYTITNCKVVTP